MEEFDIFQDIATRTKGEIYIGVVGPVRTGKSTFIKKFMDLLVIPNIADDIERQRNIDELPQSGAGRTVMTTEPKFVPDQGVEISVGDAISMRVRLVDSVGFPVEGAVGYVEEDGSPRLVHTPWFDEAIPFEEAAEVGTRKVIADHSTLGIVVTADGTFGELGRNAFVSAERRAIEELKNIGKPFMVILNTAEPYSAPALETAGEMEEEYGVPVVPIDCSRLNDDDLRLILEQALLEFPVAEVNISLPDWVEELPPSHWLRQKFEDSVAEVMHGLKRLRDVDAAIETLNRLEFVQDVILERMELGTGIASIEMTAREELFYDVLEEIVGTDLPGPAALMRVVQDMATARKEYERVAAGLSEARDRGYGIVAPVLDDINFEEPELMRKGNQFGVRLRANAPSLHILRADIATEVTPIIGTEKQSEQLVNYLMEKFEDDPAKIWQSDIFGKSLHELLFEGLQDKLYAMPGNAQQKMRETVQRILNEGGGGLICIII